MRTLSVPLLLVFLSCANADDGVLPRGADGKPLNFDFETGTLQDWVATGDAFAKQPVKGDLVAARRADMASKHQGQFWVGTYEVAGDRPTGTLTSVPFRVTHPYTSFLLGGGSHANTCVELIRKDTGAVFSRTSGTDTENLVRVGVDLKEVQGKEIFIRLVDNNSGGWGHINFDDFRFHMEKPQAAERPKVGNPDVYKFAGLPPKEAAKAMTVPAGFAVSLFAGEPDVHQPIAMCTDDRGRLWVVEAFIYPKRNPHPGPILPEALRKTGDRIVIFEDTDGDGKHDKRTTFLEGLNLVSGIELGYGGVWVGAAPYLLFIPIDETTDKPAGEPKILLDGWGSHDTHETLNSFIWGPDGWLYGCHGVFTYSRVGKPDTPDKERIPINAGIWRYHPTKHIFDVYAHGTSNPWGLDYNENGDWFAEACVIPHMWHIVQGGRYHRQAGSHFNPYTYGDIQTIAKHRHYMGATPHGGNGRSDEVGGGHAHSGLICYQGGLWPKEYHGKLFMGNIHGHRINVDVITPKGSTYEADRNPDFLLTHDRHALIVSLHQAPDGNVYFIDWYDKQSCHRNEPEIWDRTNGRVYKIVHKDTKPRKGFDLGKSTNDELIALLSSKNSWDVRHARRILQERNVVQIEPELAALPKAGSGLAVNLPVNFVGVELKIFETPSKRRHLAGLLPKVKPEERWGYLEVLLSIEEDANDPVIPLLTWYAMEPLAEVDAARALSLAAASKSAIHFPYMCRRVAALGTPAAIATLTARLKDASTPRQLAILQGIQESLKGKRKTATPAGWDTAFTKLAASPDSQVKALSFSVAASFGDPKAFALLRDVLANPKADLPSRQTALGALVNVRDPETPAVLHALLAEGSLRSSALRALAAFDDPKTPAAVLAGWKGYNSEERRDAIGTLASRPAYAKALLDAVGAKQLVAADIPADVVRQIRALPDASLAKRVEDVWGQMRNSPADRLKAIAEWKRVLNTPGQDDLNAGRSLYAKICQQCHTLFAVGGKVGPDITGSNRANLDYLLENILDPSAVIPKDYMPTTFSLNNGRTIIGIIKGESANAYDVQTSNEVLSISKADVEDKKQSSTSMMPDDQLKPLSQKDVRNLFAYLRNPAQVPLLATAENAKDFFNGKTLSGWVGDPKLWSVENGEIVGKTDGLKTNEFLKSEMAADNFVLSLKVKLTPNGENSGIQFRSEVLPNGDVKGPQADVGAGWWGKLYEEHGRGLLAKEGGEKFVKPGEWNDYTIEAYEGNVRITINGQICTDYLQDAQLSRRGIFALQLHSGGKMEVRFKDLKLEPIAKK
jgi:putative membrane-bound dehydrogenase-like protein